MLIRHLFIVPLFSFFPFITSAQGVGKQSLFRVMEYNVENLFDCSHDSLKNDHDFTPEGLYQWTPWKYWRKVNAIARAVALASTSSSKPASFLSKNGLCGDRSNEKCAHDSEK